MKSFTLLVLLIIVLVSCGGSKTETAGLLGLDLGVELPIELSELDSEKLKAYASLNEGGSIIVSEVAGSNVADGYHFSFEGIGKGKYLLKIDFFYANEEGNFKIASAEIQLEWDNANITAENFSDVGGGDADGDGLSNLDEIRLGLSPVLKDSDGDGVPDGADAFPSLASEYSDLDGDGLGDNVDADIDGDGVENDVERALGSNPNSKDSDNDGVSDNLDNCLLYANKDQIDTDNDGGGDECDNDTDGDGLSDSDEKNLGTSLVKTDTDGDGLSDKAEVDAGLNPLAADTDNDTFPDKEDLFALDKNEWSDSDSDGVGDNADNCVNIANGDQLNTDYRLFYEEGNTFADADLLGDACDEDIDGDGLNYVYVDEKSGSDENIGVFAEPVKSIKRAVILAYERNAEKILVAGGLYDLSDVTFSIGTKLLGGFDGATFLNHGNVRDIRSKDPKYKTVLMNSGSAVTLHLKNEDGMVLIDGFHIINDTYSQSSTTIILENSGITLKGNTIYSNESAKETTSVHINKGSPVIEANWLERKGVKPGNSNRGILVKESPSLIKNNIIRSGHARHATAVEIINSNPIIANNTIDGTSYAGIPLTSTGFLFEDSAPVVVNNIIIAHPLNGSDAVGMKCLGESPSSGVFNSNIFSVFGEGGSDALFVDCEGSFYYDVAFGVGLAEVSGNQAFAGGFNELFVVSDPGEPFVSTYELAGPGGVSSGVDANILQYGEVSTDYDGKKRLPGSYEIGAKEK